MKQYLTRKNIGWALTVMFALPLIPSIFGKLTQMDEVIEMLGTNRLEGWILILGIGELLALVLFIIPKTMRFGVLLISAYFGGAIVFHMTNPIPERQPFVGPTVFLVASWAIAWVRGLDIFQLESNNS